MPRPGHPGMRPFNKVGVLVLIDIDHGVSAEVDRVRTSDKGGVVEVRIKYFPGQRLPSSSRAAIKEPRPGRTDSPESLFDFRNELVVDGVAVGTDIRRIYSIGIVVELRRVLYLDHQNAREPRARPRSIKAMRL